MSEQKYKQLASILTDIANILEDGGLSIKRQIAELFQVDVSESVFTSLQGWEQRTGNKLQDFEVTSRNANNDSDAYYHAFNLLRAHNVSINHRFHGEDYTYAYWIYRDALYRQQLTSP